MSDEAANCTECGEPCVTGCIKRRDAADEQHDFHVDCYIAMSWWLGGSHDDPSESDPEWIKHAYPVATQGLRAPKLAYPRGCFLRDPGPLGVTRRVAPGCLGAAPGLAKN